MLATIEPRITCVLGRRGRGDGGESTGETDPWAAEAPVLAGLAAASVQGIADAGVYIRTAAGPRAADLQGRHVAVNVRHLMSCPDTPT